MYWRVSIYWGWVMVPSGWDKHKLGNISHTVTSGSRDWAQYYSEIGSKFVRMTNLSRDGIYLKLENMKYVDLQSNSADGKRTSLQSGDILISITAELGKIGWVPNDFGEAYINQHTALVRLDLNKAESKYIAYLLSSKTMNHKINRLNDSGAKAGLNLPTIRSIPLILPPLPEQRKIAQILSTWDKAISATEVLIANSQQQKKSLMQQLLTGKKCLLDDSGKPFEGKWEEVRLQEYIESFTNGYAFSATNYKSNGIPIITMGNIGLDGSFNERISKQNYWVKDSSLDKYLVSKGDLLIAMTDVTPNKNLIGRMAIVNIDKDYYLNQRVGLIKLKPSIDATFLRYLSNHLEWRKYSIAVSASGVQANMSTKDIKSGKLKLPNFKEQQKIASVLTAADQEIDTLQQKCNHLKQEKKALMQQLLTGKRRVNV